MQKRLNIGQRRASHARDELLDRGWIRIIEPGTFTRKDQQATVYALNNEPLTNADGAIASKDFMRWQPPEKNSTAVNSATDSSCGDYRATRPAPEKCPDGSCDDYRNAGFSGSTVAVAATQIGYQRERSERAVLLWPLLRADFPDDDAFKLCLAYVALNHVDESVDRMAA